ncbi:hypothetical protein RHGRI_013082 [Rhododendron griersonianum]|uniref:Uncharacterized protein n=1 Tax=Rhododendron griersonianum TaxID=479676 RepID=A0AAV6K4H1_9ERIC|nr:hypothetical protein RHGRI_013082 [Rhododendron griersonianum]
MYWTNAYDTQDFPLFTTELFDASGNKYSITQVLNNVQLTFNVTAYKEYSIAHLSAYRIGSIPLLFAAISTSLVHMMIHYRRY